MFEYWYICTDKKGNEIQHLLTTVQFYYIYNYQNVICSYFHHIMSNMQYLEPEVGQHLSFGLVVHKTLAHLFHSASEMM